MDNMLDSPLWGILLTCIAFAGGTALQRRFRTPLMNGYFLAVSAIIVFLLLTDIPFETYNIGGAYLTFLMGPATVALAVPLYRQWDTVKRNKRVVFLSTIVAACLGILSAAGIALLLGADDAVVRSLSVKSVTNPIAVRVAETIGGIPSLSAAAVVVTGILGAVLGPEVLHLFGIKNPVAQGLAIGAASHALGTTRAFQQGETEGAFSSIALALTGVFTALFAPLFFQWFF